jgi:hypothetical protein
MSSLAVIRVALRARQYWQSLPVERRAALVDAPRQARELLAAIVSPDRAGTKAPGPTAGGAVPGAPQSERPSVPPALLGLIDETSVEARAVAPPAAARTAQPAGSVSRATLSGAFDAANIGGFSFTSSRSGHNLQLSVGRLGAPGNIGGVFSLEAVPPRTWLRLEDRVGRVLPVWVLIDLPNIDVAVGGGPPDAPVVQPVDQKGPGVRDLNSLL